MVSIFLCWRFGGGFDSASIIGCYYEGNPSILSAGFLHSIGAFRRVYTLR